MEYLPIYTRYYALILIFPHTFTTMIRLWGVKLTKSHLLNIYHSRIRENYLLVTVNLKMVTGFKV